MYIAVYLHDYLTDMIQCFGSVDMITNKIIDAAMEGKFDLETCPSCSSTGKLQRHYVNITNEEYLKLREIKGASSNSISIRRALYWVVDNEQWDLLDLDPVGDYVSHRSTKYIIRASKIADELFKLQKEVPAEVRPSLIKIIKVFKEEVLNVL